MMEKEEIKFYVAECMEFTILGEFIENIDTLEEAIKIYNRIPSKRLNGVKGIGFSLYKNGEYDSSFDLVNSGKVDVEMINYIPDYKNSSLVQKAVADALRVFK